MGYVFEPRTFGLKYIVLTLLTKREMTGAELIETINKMTFGFFHPSPGSIYPLLKILLQNGYITLENKNGKKSYSISKRGREYMNTIMPPFNILNELKRNTNDVDEAIEEIKNYIQFLSESNLSKENKELIKKLIKDLQKIISQ